MAHKYRINCNCPKCTEKYNNATIQYWFTQNPKKNVKKNIPPKLKVHHKKGKCPYTIICHLPSCNIPICQKTFQPIIKDTQ